MITNKPLHGQDVWKDIWVHLKENEAVLTAFHILAHEALTHSGNQDALPGTSPRKQPLGRYSRLGA